MPLKVTVTGASGRIAYSLIPLLCQGDALGKDVRIELTLLDIIRCQTTMDGVKLEIEDSAFDLVESVTTTVDAETAFVGCQVAILLGGFPRTPGMERRDLIGKNASIMLEHAGAIERHADRNVKVIVIANPANTNCLLASMAAPSIPKKNFTCLTRLDHDRLSGLVAHKVNELYPHQPRINTGDVRDVVIFGNHSTTQVPYVDAAAVRVDGQWRRVTDVITDAAWLTSELAPKVQHRGAEIMTFLKASSAMSAARAITRHLYDWLGPNSTPSSTFSMGVCSDGNPYDLPAGLVISFPCRRRPGGEAGEYEIVAGLDLSVEQRVALQTSVDELMLERTMAAN